MQFCKLFKILDLDFDADWINNKANTNRAVHILINEYVLIILFTLLSVGGIIVFYHMQLLGSFMFFFFVLLNLFLKLSVRTEPRVVYFLNILLTYVPLIILSYEISKDFKKDEINGLSDILIYLIATFVIFIILIITTVTYKRRCKNVKGKVNIKRANSKDVSFIRQLYNKNKNRRFVSIDLNNEELNNLKNKKIKQNELWIIYACCRRRVGWINLKPIENLNTFSHTYEISIYIERKFQNQKYATSALSLINQKMKKLGSRTILAKMSDFDSCSQLLFKSMNFVQYGYLPNVVKDGNHYNGLYILGKRY